MATIEDIGKVMNLMAMGRMGVKFREHENVDDYLVRVENELPDLLENIFGNKEQAREIFGREIEMMNLLLYRERVEDGRVSRMEASPTLVIAISQILGRKLTDEDDASSFAARVHEKHPGVLFFLSPVEGEFIKILGESIRKFRLEVLTARARLIISCLVMLTSILHLVIMRTFITEVPAILSVLMWFMIAASGMMVMSAYKIRLMLARAEKSPLLI